MLFSVSPAIFNLTTAPNLSLLMPVKQKSSIFQRIFPPELLMSVWSLALRWLTSCKIKSRWLHTSCLILFGSGPELVGGYFDLHIGGSGTCPDGHQPRPHLCEGLAESRGLLRGLHLCCWLALKNNQTSLCSLVECGDFTDIHKLHQKKTHPKVAPTNKKAPLWELRLRVKGLQKTIGPHLASKTPQKDIRFLFWNLKAERRAFCVFLKLHCCALNICFLKIHMWKS